MFRNLFPYAAVLVALLVIATPVAAHFLIQEKNEERALAAREIIVRLTLINNEIHRERAIVAAFGHSGAQDDDVEREIVATDEYRSMLLPQIEAMIGAGGVLEHRREVLAPIAPALERLGTIRVNARRGAAQPYETFEAYSALADAMAQAAGQLHSELTIPGDQQVLATQLLVLIERLARERGYGVAILAEAAPADAFARARRANLVALDRLQTDIRRSHPADTPQGAMLAPFLIGIPLPYTDDAGGTRHGDGVDRVAAAYHWFNTMTAHIDDVRLAHTRLLTPAGETSSLQF